MCLNLTIDIWFCKMASEKLTYVCVVVKKHRSLQALMPLLAEFDSVIRQDRVMFRISLGWPFGFLCFPVWCSLYFFGWICFTQH